MSLLVGYLIGIACAWVARPLIRVLPLGIPERLTRPSRWVELAAGPLLPGCGALTGGAVGLRAGWHPALAPSLWLAVLLPPIVVIDVGHRVIPDSLTLPGAAVGYALAVWAAPSRAEELAAAAIAGGAVIAALSLVDPDGMGMGDAKLVVLLGAVLGERLVVAVVVGGIALLGPVLRSLRGGDPAGLSRTVPLAPYLAVGALFALLTA